MRGVPGRFIPAYLIAYVLIGVGLTITFLMFSANGATVLAALGVVLLGVTIRAESKETGR